MLQPSCHQWPLTTVVERKMTPEELLQDQWKEINAHNRHWETLAFENAKTFIHLVTIALGAAGAVVVWPSVSPSAQLVAITLFLVAAIAFSACAIRVILSIRSYLRGFYDRRHDVEKNTALRLRNKTDDSGKTLSTLIWAFGIAIAISCVLLLVAVLEPRRSILDGAKLSGADLSGVEGLSKRDLRGACGDAATKLPVGLTLTACTAAIPPSKATYTGAAGDAPQAARP